MDTWNGWLLVLGGVGMAVLLLKPVVQHVILHTAKNTRIETSDPLLKALRPGKPAIIYFTSPGCGPCRLTQTPVLQQLQKLYGDQLQVLTVNIDEQLGDAVRWGGMKVPRTFILDRHLRVYTSNLEVARLELLRQQVEEAGKTADSPP